MEEKKISTYLLELVWTSQKLRKQLNLTFYEEHVRSMSEDQFKSLIENKAREKVFKEFRNMQANHENIKFYIMKIWQGLNKWTFCLI